MISILKKFYNHFRRKETVNELLCKCIGDVRVIIKGGTLDIHPSVVLNSNPKGYHVAMPFATTLIADRQGSYISIGENTRVHGTYIHAWKSVRIGKGVLIAAGTTIVDSNGHSSDIRYARYRRMFQDTPAAIEIGDYVWIGMNSIILKGVRIGECAIIAAGSVIKKDIPPFAVVEGNPAQIVRYLDPTEALPEHCSEEILSQEEGYYVY